MRVKLMLKRLPGRGEKAKMFNIQRSQLLEHAKKNNLTLKLNDE